MKHESQDSLILPVILAGGEGSRLWPLSRKSKPKPFLSLCGENNLLQQTIKRLSSLSLSMPPLIICNKEHRFLVAASLSDIKSEVTDIILEPVQRDTAAAIAVAAAYCEIKKINPILLILPADHMIKDVDSFLKTINCSRQAALMNKLICFGVKPDFACTSYGYIRARSNKKLVSSVERFIEKPTKQTASELFSQKNVYWNSGIFMAKASVFSLELKKYCFALYSNSYASLINGSVDLCFFRLSETEFASIQKISIDYALFEHTKNAVVAPLSCEWSDIGAWDSLWAYSKKDAGGNVSQGNIYSYDTTNSLLHASSRSLVTLGLDEHLVIECAETVFVAPLSKANEIKQLLVKLNGSSYQRSDIYYPQHRPWGFYITLGEGPGFLVKRLVIYQGHSISLQRHFLRSEHWVVVEGQAEVVCDDKTFTLTSNQSTFIPRGCVHRLTNIAHGNLNVIEVQCGEFLSEDDIERLVDKYGRTTNLKELTTLEN